MVITRLVSRVLLLALSTLLFKQQVCGQAPPIQWQNTIGGNSNDLPYCSDHTSDGGLIIAGSSGSGVGGDRTEPSMGGSDIWVVKLDSAGSIEWQNAIGGIGDEAAKSIQQTLDGGYILAGYSGSGISGDKTEPLIGIYDYWVVKLDAFGNIIWQNTIGGTLNDQAACIRQTPDLGYIVAGFSLSHATGDKSEPNRGPATTSDYWVVKLDNLGNIQWDKTIGGNNYDYLHALEVTWDGGYIIGGYSQSGITGEKTEALIGSSDFWVLKLNALGNIQWQNTIGGTGSESIQRILLSADGGYILGGYSTSDISGDKTEIAYGTGSDFWVVKINNVGNIVWQNDIGGTSDDQMFTMEYAADGGYYLGGYSASGVSGDKTEGSMGGQDIWVIKIDDSGVEEWQNAIGGSSDEVCMGLGETADGGVEITAYSKSGLSGDKSEPNMGPSGTYDYWVIRTYPECIPATEICNTVDDDCNGLIDDGIVESISIFADDTTTFCQGNSVTLHALYTGTDVQWKRNGVNIAGATVDSLVVNQKGSYTCETSSACGTTLSDAMSVVVNKNPSASISPDGPLTFCAGGSVTLNCVPVGGCVYQWYKGATPIPGATGTAYVATTSGNYKCRVTKVATGCFRNSNTILVSVPCREEELSQDADFLLYPNPAATTLYLDVPVGCDHWMITDVSGREIATGVFPAGLRTCDVSALAPGVYVITTYSATERVVLTFVKS